MVNFISRVTNRWRTIRQYDVDEVFARARLVRNTVEPDPGAPTMSEVRDMIDEMLAEDEGS